MREMWERDHLPKVMPMRKFQSGRSVWVCESKTSFLVFCSSFFLHSFRSSYIIHDTQVCVELGVVRQNGTMSLDTVDSRFNDNENSMED